MFEKSTVKAYRQVMAPAGLKERVISDYQTADTAVKSKRLYQTISIMAACLVLVLSVTAFENQNRLSVLYDGEKLTKEPVTVASAYSKEAGIALLDLETEKEVNGRSISKEICIPLELCTDNEMTISVSSGKLAVFDVETGESLSCGAEYQQMDALNAESAESSGQNAGYAESAENSTPDECYTVSGTVLLDWYVEGGQEAKLYLTSGNKKSTICLCYDESEEAWVIFRE